MAPSTPPTWREAVTAMFVSAELAYACHTSAVPVWVLACAALVHVRPPPLIPVTDWAAPPRPPAPTVATNSSLGAVVENVGVLTVAAASDRFAETVPSGAGV